MVIAQLIAGGTVVNCIALPDGAAISADGSTATFADGSFKAPAGRTLMMQAGAGVGWTLANGALSAAGLPKPQLQARASQKAKALLAGTRPYVLSGGVSVVSDALTATGVDLNGLMIWGQANAAATTSWIDDNGAVTALTGAQCVALAQAVFAYGQSVYAMLATAMTGIAGGTIATTAAIDALAWPV